MKGLLFTRGNSKVRFRCGNGDVYDSTAVLFDETGKTLYRSEYVNTDATNGYKGGRVAKGRFYGIVGYRYNEKKNDWSGKRVIKFFHADVDLARVKDHTMLSDEDMTLPSDVPNPNHGGAFYVQYPQAHGGLAAWDASHACLTILNDGKVRDFDRLMEILADNEILDIEVA